jgi:hypothetical protein
MAAYTRKQYSGAARNTTTTTLLTNVGTTVDIAATTGWPAIAGIPFYVVINPSSIFEEKCLATISGSTLTLVRAQDDTTASEHPIGSIIYPVFTANDADEANELVSKLTTKGDLLTTDGTNLLRLGVGPNGYFLKASTSASAGVEWASIPTINSLNDIGDVTINNVEEGDFLVYKNSASVWINETIHFITVSDTEPTDEVRVGDLWYNSLELELYTYYSGAWVQTTDSSSGVQEIYELVDVLIDNPVSGESLVYNGTEWENGPAGSALTLENARVISLSGDVSGSVSFDGSQNITIPTTVQINSITLGTDTNGNYLSDLTQGTGVTVTHTPGEGSSPTIAIGQAVGTSSSVQFAAVTAPLIGNSSTATTLENARTISLSGDVSGSVSFDGSTNATISTTIQPNSVALGTDTTGNYMSDLTQGTGVTITHTPGEGSNATIAIGQAVGTSASVTFANVTADLVGDVTGNASTASALETARTISLAGDLSGSASFNGTTDITISASVVNSGVSLDEISDVVITSPLQFQGLMYDGTNWVNSNIPDVYLVRNNTGSTIPKGTLVGAVSAEPSGRIDVAPFQVTGTENSELRAMGIATSNISNGVNGEVMSFGTLTGLDTRGSTVSALAVGDETWAAGDILFAHPTVDGKLTNVRPQHDLAVAFITVRHASTGQIAIRIIPGNNHLEWMHDVVLTSPTDGQFLRYNSASTVWVNDAINLGTDTVGNYMSDITQGTGVTITHTPGEGSNATIAIGQAVGTSASVTFANINATGDLVVGGDLTVNGTTTTLNTETLEIEDNIIVLNSNVSGSPLTNAGVEVQRGTSDNVSIRWNETSDKWEITEDGSAYLEIGTTADISAAALTSISELPDVSTAYQIGATGPAGGIIFITPDTIGNSTGKYFEVAPSASQVQRSWATGANQSLAVSGADATGFGFGAQNTIDIVAQSGNVSATSAAAYASDYEYGGFSDWFLPSTDELQELYAVEDLDPGTIPGLLSSNYWSSTEYSATQAEYQNLGDGGQGFSAKSNSLYVRPVRAFNSPASGDFLKWNGSYWTNDPNLPTVSVSNSTIDDNSASMLLTGITVDSYGRVTGRTAATHRKASTTVPGIIQYDDDKFDYSDGPFTIKANGIELGADTTGNYMVNVSASTGISISHTQGEGSTATISTTGVQTLGAKAGNYTLAAGDAAETIIIMDSSSANDLTVPPASSVAFVTGTSITIVQRGTGKTRILAGAGVTLLATPGVYLRARYASCVLIKTEIANEWFVIGDLATS